MGLLTIDKLLLRQRLEVKLRVELLREPIRIPDLGLCGFSVAQAKRIVAAGNNCERMCRRMQTSCSSRFVLSQSKLCNQLRLQKVLDFPGRVVHILLYKCWRL